jgi:hypothetical protein
MLLVGSGGSRSLAATGATAGRGDEINLHFSVPTPGGDKHFRMAATIARVLDGANSVGIRFPQPLPAGAYQALVDFAVASGTVAGSVAQETPSTTDGPAKGDASKDGDFAEQFLRDRRIKDADAEKVKEQLRRVMSRVATRVINGFFERCDREMLTRARDAGTNAVQMMYLEGLDQLAKHRDQIRNRFGRSLVTQIDQVSDLEAVLEKRRRREAGETTKLALVDTEQFEEWLSVAEIITKAENRYGDQLLDIRARLSLIAKPWGHKDVVPIGPATITWAFDESIRDVDVRRQVKQDFYHQFEAALAPILGNLYQAVAKMLGKPGLSFGGRNPQRDGPLAAAPDGATARTARVVPAHGGVGAGGRHGGRRNPDGAPVFLQPFRRAIGGTAEVYKAARELLNLGRRARRARGVSDEVPLAPPNARPEQRYNTGDILHAIAEVEHELGDAPLTDVRLKPRLMQVLKRQHGDAKSFGEAEYDTLDVVENLVDSLEQDTFLTEGIRGWIKRLEVTLNKLATRDPEFLEQHGDEPPAVQMLNSWPASATPRTRTSASTVTSVSASTSCSRAWSRIRQESTRVRRRADGLGPWSTARTRRTAATSNVPCGERGQQKLARARVGGQ